MSSAVVQASADETVEQLILADSPVAYWKLSDPDNAASGQFKGGVFACNGILNGIYASALDSLALSITGDIDISAKAAARDWTPGGDQAFAAKWAGTQRSWAFIINSSGQLALAISTTGADAISGASSVATGVADDGVTWVRVTRVASSGVTTFYTSADGITWTQLGTTVVVSAGSSIFDSTTPLNIGANADGAERAFNGSIYRVQIRSGVGGPIAFDADFTVQPEGTTSFTEYSANGATVTVNGRVSHDYSGNALVGLQFNGIVLRRPGATTDGAKCAKFDGVNDYIQFSHHHSLAFSGGQSITIQGFARRFASGALHSIISKGRPPGSASTCNWMVYIASAGNLAFSYVDSSGFKTVQTTSTTHFPVGQWVHFAVTYTFGKTPITFYINGVAVGTTPVAGWDGAVPDPNALAGNIGGGQASEYFNGWLNHLAVHRTELPIGRIAAVADHRKSIVSVVQVEASADEGRWTFSSAPVSPSTFEVAQLEVNASGLGYAVPISSVTAGAAVTCDYTNNVVAGNAWRINDDTENMNFGIDKYLECPVNGTVV